MDIDFATQELAPVGRGNRAVRPTERMTTYRSQQVQREQRRQRLLENRQRTQNPEAPNLASIPFGVQATSGSLGAPNGSYQQIDHSHGPIRFGSPDASGLLFQPSLSGISSPGIAVHVATSQSTEVKLYDDPDLTSDLSNVGLNGSGLDLGEDQTGDLSPVEVNIVSGIQPTLNLVHRSSNRNAGPISDPFQSTAMTKPPVETVTGSTRKCAPEADFPQGSPPRKRPRTGDLERTRKRLVELAIEHFRAALATENAFPDANDADAMALDAFWMAFHQLKETLGLSYEEHKPTETDLKLIIARIPQLCGDVKTKCRNAVEQFYKFEVCTTEDRAEFNRNRDLVQFLLEKATFTYKNPYDKTIPGSLFGHALFYDVIRKTFFSNHEESLGIKRAAYFQDNGGIPLPTLALVATATHCAIDEWQTGIHRNRDFTANEYAKIYQSYLKTLEDWRDYTSTRRQTTSKLQRQHLILARYNADISMEVFVDRYASLTVEDFAATEGVE
ncbi:hypothetical protein NLI96_g3380 [Meripilus lineatus]|uniref:DUF6532 domain-containing protein n=1 Tax=Meripilus lineatus TaxID=2056292 RepID=A0AAD5V8Y4_9APHY|nr:hypothetical protein NLI96_g3380 [Physisporinus lineatus]